MIFASDPKEVKLQFDPEAKDHGISDDTDRYIRHSRMLIQRERLLPQGLVKALYRADRCGVAIGGTLSSFPDLSGNSYNCALVGGGTAPSVRAQPTNGVPVVYYSTANRAHTRASFLGGLTGVTICALYWPGASSVVGGCYVGDAPFTQPVAALGNTYLSGYYIIHATSSNQYVQVQTPNDTWRIALYSCTSATVLCRSYYKNPSSGIIESNTSQVTNQSGVLPGSSFSLGGRPDAGYNFAGDLAEVFVLSDALWNIPNFDPLAYFKDQYPFLGG